MARSRRQNVVKWPQFRRNSSGGVCKRHRAGCSAKFVLVVTILIVLVNSFVTGTNAQEPIIYQHQQASERAYVAGSHLLAWWGQRGDVRSAIAQLGDANQCSEVVNTRVDSELLDEGVLSSCRREAADYDVKELLELSEEIAMPSQEQTTRLCRSEACAAWLTLAAEATWLPECRYRGSQMSFRSMAETLLRIRGDLVTSVSGAVVAPNASLFREFYELNQLSNLLNATEDVLNEVGSPVMVARHLAVQEDFSLMGSGDSPELSAAVEPPGSSSGRARSASSSSSSASGPSSGSSSASNSASVGDDFLSGSDFNSSDSVGFTGSGIGPHASSTATTTELTPSYAYVVGAWVLFNGSYFFLMRRK
ncbi:hypothetical protein P3T76_009866 [Phytophthora citrophthora]|uniref:Uncharacterized protein n=1 Tax=Phytophthora citrophthora TaxID=4793 RepID=A0AAD9LHP5_9STRA|nr:hypothetical protein P3T76_009866 [Phytophthora citrophthora]